jgi:hypothetical protein
MNVAKSFELIKGDKGTPEFRTQVKRYLEAAIEQYEKEKKDFEAFWNGRNPSS